MWTSFPSSLAKCFSVCTASRCGAYCYVMPASLVLATPQEREDKLRGHLTAALSTLQHEVPSVVAAAKPASAVPLEEKKQEVMIPVLLLSAANAHLGWRQGVTTCKPLAPPRRRVSWCATSACH